MRASSTGEFNALLKLALNGVYGDSNNQYSPFFDPLYTMKITINGQLLLCMLAEALVGMIPEITMIQINTDGLTIKFPREHSTAVDNITACWERATLLTLEHVQYSHMFIRDVNNYIAVNAEPDDNGVFKIKRKGCYQTYSDLGWHQNHGALVVPMAAEAALVYGQDIRQFITTHTDMFDFFMRTKVPRSSKLMLSSPAGEVQLQNITRYYASVEGSADSGHLIKIMPPTPKALAENAHAPDRRIGIATATIITPCNNVAGRDFSNIDFEYYIAEAEKIVEPLRATPCQK